MPGKDSRKMISAALPLTCGCRFPFSRRAWCVSAFGTSSDAPIRGWRGGILKTHCTLELAVAVYHPHPGLWRCDGPRAPDRGIAHRLADCTGILQPLAQLREHLSRPQSLHARGVIELVMGERDH